MCKKVRIIFFGDLALIKGIGDLSHVAAEETFGDILDLLKSADIVVGNLEAPHPGDGSKNNLKKPYIIADEKEFCKILVLKPDVLTLANNHIFDALEPGYAATVDFLKANNISFLGAGMTAEEASKPVIIERNGLKVGFLSYICEDTNPKISKKLKGALNIFSLNKAMDDIKKLKQIVDFCAVLLHWGVDYCRFPSPEQRETALSLSSVGADLIVGNHAHVIQPVERLNKAIVAYGLGNFYFPDFMQDNELRKWRKENKESLLLDVTLDEQGVSKMTYHRTKQNNFTVKLESAGIQNYIRKIRYIGHILRWKPLWETYLRYRVKNDLVYRYLFKRNRSPVSQFLSLKSEHIRRFFVSQDVSGKDIKMINILHIIESLPIGGAENLLLTLARNINRDKFNLLFCCLRDEGYVADRLKEEGFKVVCVGKYRVRQTHKKISDIIKLIKTENIDIVHTHLIEANIWGRIIAHLSFVPVVCRTRHAILTDIWKRQTLGRRVYLILDRILDRLSKRVIYVSESQRQVIKGGSYDPFKDIVVHNAFDEYRFTVTETRETLRCRYKFCEGDIIIGMVGRLVPHKGHTYLFEAVKEIGKIHEKVKILVIGSGPEEIRLKELARALDLNVLFMSLRADVPELMKTMDIFVHAPFREAFGVVLTEAMFLGLPVVATNNGGVPEIVIDEQTGILIPPKDSEAMKVALLRLLENPDIAKRMGEKGREVAVSKFNGQRYAKDMENVYISLVKEKKV